MRNKKIIKMIDIVPSPKFLEPIEPEPVEPVEPVELGKPEEERIFTEDIFTPKTKKLIKKPLIIAGVICLIILGIIFYFTISKAEVILKLKTEAMQFQTELNLNKNVAFIDLENNKIPAQLFQVEQETEREFPATREKDVKEKATGTIIIYNQYSSAPQALVKTTRFISEEGKLFRTVDTITIPGAKVEEGQIIPSTIEAKIIAAEPGEEYNIEPSSFTIPGFKGTAKYTGFYGKSTQPMAGGMIGRVKVVSAEDIQGAKEILAIELKENAENELKKRIPTELKILNDTSLVEIVESSSNVEPDQSAEKFTVKVKVAAKMLGFDENDAISLINDNLKNKVSEDKTILPDTIEIKYTINDINLENGMAKLTCEVKESLAWKIDLDTVRKELAGKNEIEVRQYLASRSEIESAKVIFWPFWVKKIPSNENKIKITID